jgi:hypothetical protein
MSNKMIPLTGLWKNTDKNGNPYLSGYLGGAVVMVFPNGHKKENKQPDYLVYVAPKKEKEKPQEETPS